MHIIKFTGTELQVILFENDKGSKNLQAPFPYNLAGKKYVYNSHK